MSLFIMDLLKIRDKLPKYLNIFYIFISIFSIVCLLVFYNRIDLHVEVTPVSFDELTQELYHNLAVILESAL